MLKNIRESRKTEKFIDGIFFAVAALIALAFLIPMVYTIISAFKPLEDITSVPIRWIPQEIRWENFTEPFREKNFGRYFFNSTIVAIIVTSCSLFFCSMAGYSLSKYEYKGRDFFFVLVLVTMMVPIETTIVPLAMIVRKFGWMNSYAIARLAGTIPHPDHRDARRAGQDPVDRLPDLGDCAAECHQLVHHRAGATRHPT